MNRLIWKSEEEQKAEFKKIKKERAKEYGQDGYIECARGIFSYKGIKYLIRILRYFTFREGFKPLGSKRISDMHAVVESQEDNKKTKSIVNAVSEFDSEFLYHDTLHYQHDKMTIAEQIEDAHRMAKRNINWLLEGDIIVEINNKIKDLMKKRRIIQKLR